MSSHKKNDAAKAANLANSGDANASAIPPAGEDSLQRDVAAAGGATPPATDILKSSAKEAPGEKPREQVAIDEAKTDPTTLTGQPRAADAAPLNKPEPGEKTPEQAGRDEEAAKLREAAQSDALAASEAEKARLQKDLNDLLADRERLHARLDKTDSILAELAQKLDRPKDAPATLRLVSQAFNPEKALDRLADIWPKDQTALRQVPVFVNSKTCRVTPTGKNSDGLPIADVRLCSDEADAKAAYYLAIKREVPCKVDVISVEYHERKAIDPPADPGSPEGHAA